jgi:hypothetical protein
LFTKAPLRGLFVSNSRSPRPKAQRLFAGEVDMAHLMNDLKTKISGQQVFLYGFGNIEVSGIKNLRCDSEVREKFLERYSDTKSEISAHYTFALCSFEPMNLQVKTRPNQQLPEVLVFRVNSASTMVDEAKTSSFGAEFNVYGL